MTLARGEREWALLVSEYNICKKKLESKRQALKILMGDLESCQRERDIYKNKIKQMQQEIENYKKKELEHLESKDQRGKKSPATSPSVRSPEHIRIKRERKFSGQSIWEQELQSVRDRKNKTLSQLLCESREENKALKNDFMDLRVLYREAQEDIILLRENVARQKASEKASGKMEDLEARQNLIQHLENNKEKVEELEREVQAAADEKNEITIERDHYRDKVERLNVQLNYILGADEKRLVDIDAILMENRYQKEQIKQLKEENRIANASLARHKAALEKKKARLAKAGYTASNAYIGGAGVKQALPSLISEISSSFSGGVSSSTVSDLQSLANSLSESLSEKDIALLHQRNTNRILGNRVAELEKKLKTLEVSGLWSLEGHRGYGSEEMLKLYLEKVKLRSPLSSTTEADAIPTSDTNGETLSPETSPDLNNIDSAFFAGDSELTVHEEQLLNVHSAESDEEGENVEHLENNNGSSTNDLSCCDLSACKMEESSYENTSEKEDSPLYIDSNYTEDSKVYLKGHSSPRESSENSPLNTQEKHSDCKYGTLGHESLRIVSSEDVDDKPSSENQSQNGDEEIQTLDDCDESLNNSTSEHSEDAKDDEAEESPGIELENQSHPDADHPTTDGLAPQHID